MALEVETGSAGEEGDAGGGLSSLLEFAQFIGRAVRLNLLLGVAVAILCGGIGFTLVSAITPVYEATFRLYVQEGGAVTTSIVSGREYRPAGAGKGLDEFLYARDNLMLFVRDARLVESWPRTRAWPLRLKDRLVTSLVGPPDKAAMQRVFAEMLYDQITYKKEGDSTRVSARWRDAENAYDIARVAERYLLATRAQQEFGPIARAIPFLESQQEQADQEVEAAVRAALGATKKLPVIAAATPGTRPSKTDAAEAASRAASEASLSELASVSRELAEVRREKRALVEPARARAAELKSKLIDLRAQYSGDHPLVRQMEARIGAADMDSEEIARLRARETELAAVLASRISVRRPNPGGESGTAENTPDPLSPTSTQEAPIAPSNDDLGLAPAKQRVSAALKKSDEITSRLELARLELQSAEAEFRNRYVVVEEPEVPSAPLKSKKTMFMALSLLAAVLLGIAAATVREMIRGRLVEAWQVRALGIPLLAEVELKKLPRPE